MSTSDRCATVGVRIDLHTHSRASATARRLPTELVRAAADAGLDVLALTDHDTARRLGRGRPPPPTTSGSTLVRGHRDQHPLRGTSACTCWPTCPTRRTRPGRRARPRAGRPQLPGARDPRQAARARHRDHRGRRTPRVRRHAAPPGGRTSPTRWSRQGVVADRDEAFGEYLNPGRPAYVDRYAAAARGRRAMVVAAGGVPVVAHPWGRNGPAALPTSTSWRGCRRSAWPASRSTTRTTTAAARDGCATIARDLDLVVTGSSDYHGAGKLDHDLGCNTTAPDAVRAAARPGRSAPPPRPATPEVRGR